VLLQSSLVHKRERDQSKLEARLVTTPEARNSALWTVTEEGEVYCLKSCGKKWNFPLPRPWRALRITSSASGTVWVCASAQQRECAIWALMANETTWTRQITCVHAPQVITAAGQSCLWILQNEVLHLLCERTVVKAPRLPFRAIHISEGADRTFWAVGGEKRFGGYSVWRRNPDEIDWFSLPRPAAATRISGAPDGSAWSANSRGQIWRLHPHGAGNFQECGISPSCQNCLYSSEVHEIRDLSVGPDGVVWVLSTDQTIGRIVDFQTRKIQFFVGTRAISLSAGTWRFCM
jgi:hypothetical protein